MKKLLMLVLVLWAAGAYSQEIRMPDEKRKDYVKERETNKSPTDSKTTQQRDSDAERKKQAELARKQRAEEIKANQTAKGNSVYCIIREMSNLKEANTKVTILVEEKFEGHVKRMDDDTQKQMMTAIQKRAYASGLDALSAFTQSNWSLVETSVYSWQEMAVREYLMEYQLPVR